MAETLTVRVTEREIQGAEVVVLTLASPDGAPCPRLAPGRISIYILAMASCASIRCAAAPITRSAIGWGSSDRASRGGSLAAHALQPGDEVQLALRATCSRWRCRRLIAF